MRFTFPILTLCHGGAQRMLVELTNGLTARGHQVIILMPLGGDVSYTVHSTLLITDYPLLRETDYPVSDVIVSNFYTTVPVSEAASRNGKGLHVRLSLCYEPPFLPQNEVSFPSYHITDKLIVLSRWQQELIELGHGISGSIVPVGISTAFKNMHIRHRLQEPLNITAILRKVENGFSWHREQDYLVQQLDSVKANLPEVNINFISPPDEFYSSESLQSMKRSGKYRFFTPKDDHELCYHYNGADIFVSSSIFDTGSLPGLEAMRCGAALVTVYSGGNLEYARHEENCLLSFRHENRLAADIIRLIQDPALRIRLASKGEADSKRWTWNNSVRIMEQTILGFLNGNSIHPPLQSPLLQRLGGFKMRRN
ncbi:glycosyltransferase family 4 protein [Paenibacillus sp. MMS20-IR301]|uniref:glycosyltransferase family 4 protein n=1 Tax=Paenibacillus sp. MMS20-IR301 TaxID=2895946 RepID=UPI0028EE9E85|nr:glycosyltransferase family 4 protein [Paenibacillus sp. MMS20-IR301]WNS45944.1 glycosyltransferase family 4 protein [Paenibacillus sp. MMS20-IR301]